MTILDQIVAQKRIEIAERMAAMPISALEQMPDFKRMPLSARDAVQDFRSTGIRPFVPLRMIRFMKSTLQRPTNAKLMLQPAPADRPELLYLFDPLCGWCYGMSPVIRRVQEEFAGQLDVSVLCGGMVTGEQAGPIRHNWPYISGALEQVQRVTGAEDSASCCV